MRTLNQNRQKNLTLKQYLHSTSLRKRLSSRSNSKQKKDSMQGISFTKGIADLNQLSRDHLIQQFKLKLTEIIKNDRLLMDALNMFDKIIQHFGKELHTKTRQNGLLQTMIATKNLVRDTFMKNKDEDTPRSINAISNLNIERIDSSRKDTSSRKSSFEFIKNHCRNISNTSSEQIPNINVLLMTRNEPLMEKIQDQQTEETLMEEKKGMGSSQSKVSIDLNTSKDEQNNYLNITLNSLHKSINNQTRSSATKKEEEGIKDSFHSRFWKTPPSNQILNRFQQMKRRLEK